MYRTDVDQHGETQNSNPLKSAHNSCTDAAPGTAGLFNSVFHAVNDPIVIIELPATTQIPLIQDVNQPFEQATGLTATGIKGLGFFDIFGELEDHPDTIAQNGTSRHTNLGAGEYKMNVSCPNGRILPVICSIQPYRTEENNKHFIAIVRPETEQELSNIMTSRVLSSMSHDLRTPLNGILGFSQIMMAEMLGPIGTDDYRDYARDIFGAGRDLLRMIDGLMDITHVLQGQTLALQHSTFPLKECLDATIRETLTRHKMPSSRVSIRMSRNIGEIKADRPRLSHVLSIMLTSAVTRAPHDSKVSISVKKNEENFFMIRCRHDGKHLSKQELANIFEPFTVGEDTFKTGETFFGVGFPLVRVIVEQHGGSVSVSNHACGVDVTIALPAG